MKRFLKRALAAAAMGLLQSSVASASTITYDFTVDVAPGGPLYPDVASGTFSFDSSVIPSGGGNVFATGLLTALDFTWDGTAYTAATANTGLLGFNPGGDLYTFEFGNNCVAGSCSVAPFINNWYVFPATDGLVYSTSTSDGFYEGSVTYSLAVPEPPTYGLMLVGASLLGFFGCRKSRASEATALA